MRIATILVTRGKSCHVKTLHTILKFNIRCMKTGTENEVIFVNDEPFEKAEIIYKYLKSHDRIFFVDFGISVDEGSLDKVFEKHDGVGCLVFPGVTEGIDWGMFKEKVISKYNEPIEQMGLHFDTIVANRISDDIYAVNETSAKSWVMMNKNVMKHLKDKKIWIINNNINSSFKFNVDGKQYDFMSLIKFFTTLKKKTNYIMSIDVKKISISLDSNDFIPSLLYDQYFNNLLINLYNYYIYYKI